jgi:nitroimidazol reductase NimA-like FMN-containing flavoprotein (pyridoxamine 5'-phosphate oxidase superfamily)
VRRRGPWSEAQIESFLADARKPLRLSCNGGAGTPLLASLWFLPDGDRLWCATQRSARMAERLRDDGRCAFEVAEDAAPYCGVRGQGEARLHDARGAEVLDRLIERYLDDPRCEFAAWLRSRADDETAIEIVPDRLLSWDFGDRMPAASGDERA